MNDRLFDINNFNIIQDAENYYFFRALNMADNSDIEQNITAENGNIERIRTDRERYDGETKYAVDSKITLEELYDHIKRHYRKDTNCISLTSNANVAVNYGRGSIKFFLLNWCTVNKNVELVYNESTILNIKSPCLLKLTFRKNELINLEQID